MKVGIKRFDTTLPLPEYKSSGAAALDLYARIEVSIPAHEVAYVPLNIALELPENTWALIAARSSLHKKKLQLINGIGVGDYDYRGDADEYRAALFNFSDTPVVVARGERIAQLLVMPMTRIELAEKDSFSSENRGGFGTTGKL